MNDDWDSYFFTVEDKPSSIVINCAEVAVPIIFHASCPPLEHFHFEMLA